MVSGYAFDRNPPAGWRRYATNPTILICCIVAMLDGADSQSMAISAPLVARDLNIPSSQLGLVFSSGLLGAAVGAMAFGILARRWGAKAMLILSTVVFGLFQFLTSYAESFTGLMFVRIAAGIGLGGAPPCFLALAGTHVSLSERPKLFGLLWAFFPIGGFVGGLLNGWLVQSVGWQVMFVVGGVAPIVMAAITAFVARDGSTERLRDEGTSSVHETSFRDFISSNLERRRHILATAVIFFVAFGALSGVVAWTPTLLATAGFAPFLGGSILSWHAMGALVSMASAGFLLERFGRGMFWISLMLSALLLISVGLSLQHFLVLVVFMVALGVTLGVAASGGIAFTSQILPEVFQSTGLGWAMAIGRFGQTVLPAVMGWIITIDPSGRTALFALSAVTCSGAGLAWVLLRAPVSPKPLGCSRHDAGSRP